MEALNRRTVNVLEQNGPTGGPQVTTGPRPFVTRPAGYLLISYYYDKFTFSLLLRI
jgi:hypothetical protein